MDSRSFVRHHVRAVRRQLWLVAIVLAAVLLSAGVLLSRQTSTYRASTKIVVGQGGGVFEPGAGGVVDSFTLTMADLLQSRVVAESVIRDLQLRMTSDQLLHRLGVSTQPESAVLTVTYDSADRHEALAVLDDVGRRFADLVGRRLGGGQSGPAQRVSVSVFDPAHLLPGPLSPRPARTLLVAVIAGLLVGALLAVAREMMRPRLYGAAEVQAAFAAPVLGTLSGRVVEGPPGPLPSDRRGERPRRQRDALAANVRFGEFLSGGQLIVVTSVQPGEGTTVVAANLAIALAAADDVVCVEADASGRSLSTYLRAAPGDADLADVLAGRVALGDALVEVTGGRADAGERPPVAGEQPGAVRTSTLQRAGRLRLLSGAQASRAARPLTPEAATRLAGWLRESARYVIIHAPPLLEGAGALMLAGRADAVIVAVRDGRTTAADAALARSIVDGLTGTNVGVVLTDSDETVPEYWPLLRR